MEGVATPPGHKNVAPPVVELAVNKMEAVAQVSVPIIGLTVAFGSDEFPEMTMFSASVQPFGRVAVTL